MRLIWYGVRAFILRVLVDWLEINTIIVSVLMKCLGSEFVYRMTIVKVRFKCGRR